MRNAATFIASQRSVAATGLLQGFVRSAMTMVRAWKNRRQLAYLSDLDDHLLADLGLTREDVRSALDLPFAHDPGLELQRRALRNRQLGWRE